jgi:hypothetical protein
MTVTPLIFRYLARGASERACSPCSFRGWSSAVGLRPAPATASRFSCVAHGSSKLDYEVANGPWRAPLYGLDGRMVFVLDGRLKFSNSGRGRSSVWLSGPPCSWPGGRQLIGHCPLDGLQSCFHSGTGCVRQSAWLRSERASGGGTVRPAPWSSRGGRCRAAQHIALGRRGRATAAAAVA